MIIRLSTLVEKYLPNAMPKLQEIITLYKARQPFKQGALQLIFEIEETIPGVGIHYSITNGHHYYYPFDKRFEAVIRPMRYALNGLGGAYAGALPARYSVQTSPSGHLEGCLKVLLGRSHRRDPLGRLIRAKKVKEATGEEFAKDVSVFTDLVANPAKHSYDIGEPEPIFQFRDALYAHFLSRHFGSVILRSAGVLDLVTALRPTSGQKVRYFCGVALPISYD